MRPIPLAVLLTALSQPVLAFYAPGEGRWLSRDPIGESDASNRYLFVRNRPVTSVDRLGLATIAAGTRPVEMVGGLWGLANHLSLEYFDTDHPAGSVIRMPSTSSVELLADFRYRILIDATLIPVSQSKQGNWLRAPDSSWWGVPTFPLPVPVSYIHKGTRPIEVRAIYCGADAQSVWDDIVRTSSVYPYAEDSKDTHLRKWPQSAYGIPVPGFYTWNNSNTFVRDMTQRIPGAPSPDVFPGRRHPGNDTAVPVSGMPFSLTPSLTPGPENTLRLQVEMSNDYIQRQFTQTWLGALMFQGADEVPWHLNVIPMN